MVFVCGGTGGHVFPALAIAEETRKMYPQTKIKFIIKKGGFEEKVVKQAGFLFDGIRAEGFNRSRPLINLRLIYILPMGFVKSFVILLQSKPKLVISTGGYSGVPVLLSAVIQKRQIALQEQNSYPGITVRFFARFAKVVFIACNEARNYLPKRVKIIEAGNPMRASTGGIEKNLRKEYGLAETDRVLFIFGGSQGARGINNVIKKEVARIVGSQRVVIFWQTGKPDYEEIKIAMSGLGRVHIFPFIENIYDFYRAADLAVCRAGAMTISELGKFGVPAVFVPLPTAAEDHQKKNAEMVERNGAGICIDQSQANEKLFNTVSALLNDDVRLKKMSDKMGKLFHGNAASDIATELERMMAA